ncbi:MAG TPA: LLM class flavin-dependent oxidoreductase [Steroidobacteraceae bacterium]|nr:LLM class flavin-dependent oxidoreductase [Steroidobacteraceae bacterium]
MKFGVMDHMDDGGLAPARQYADRLNLVAAMDRLGFDSYHVAEHHGTPLGLAPSPNLWLSAIAQRTTRLKFGPLVYVAVLYHPMRLAEEICMLDQLSGGRLQVGIGRGAVGFEQELYGIDPASAAERYAEARDLLLAALTSRTVDFEGHYYRVRDFPMVLQPHQQPRPPLWYGLTNPEVAPWAAAHAANVISLRPAGVARAALERYREEWERLGHAQSALPCLGLARHVVVAATDAQARRIARAAFPRWRASLCSLWQRRGAPLPLNVAADWDELERTAMGVAGTPERVRGYVTEQCALAHGNCFLAQMVFGGMAYEDALASLTLFATEVMPPLAPL